MNAPGQPVASVAELMSPRSVAIIGASEDPGKFGGRIFRTLVEQGFSGPIYPISSARREVLGRRAWQSIAEVPERVDLVIMAIPREHIPDAVGQCAAAGVRGAIVVTSRFSDAGEEGAALERELVATAHARGMRILGPNCIGIVSPASGFALCPSPVLLGRPVLAGYIGLVSQSGAIMGTLMDRARTGGIGFSHCVSVGNQADIDVCEVADFLIEDASTRVICTYLEGLRTGAAFLAAAERAQRAAKPWLMVKAGRTDAGAAAAFSHTASLAGSQAAFEAASRERGIVLLDDPEAMILLAAGLAQFPARKVEGVALFSPSGGGCALGADRLSDIGAPMPAPSESTAVALRAMYPTALLNPIDIGAANDGAAMSYTSRTHELLLADASIDLALTVITAAPDITRFAEMAAEGVLKSGKPAIMVVLPGEAAEGARHLLRERRIVHTQTLDTAIRAIRGWRDWSAATRFVPAARPPGLGLRCALPCDALGEQEAKQLLAEYGIPVNRSVFVASAKALRQEGSRLAPPYVLKIVSSDIVHKSDVGGVAVGIRSIEELESAAKAMLDRIATSAPGARIQGFSLQEQANGELELLLGTKYDEVFGPMILVGAGGIFAELLADTILATAPVSEARALDMLSRLRIAPRFYGTRGRPAVDVTAAAQAISRLSWLAADGGALLRELDVNPLLVREAGSGCVAVDARALLTESISEPGSESPEEAP